MRAQPCAIRLRCHSRGRGTRFKRLRQTLRRGRGGASRTPIPRATRPGREPLLALGRLRPFRRLFPLDQPRTPLWTSNHLCQHIIWVHTLTQSSTQRHRVYMSERDLLLHLPRRVRSCDSNSTRAERVFLKRPWRDMILNHSLGATGATAGRPQRRRVKRHRSKVPLTSIGECHHADASHRSRRCSGRLGGAPYVACIRNTFALRYVGGEEQRMPALRWPERETAVSICACD